jgi:hypothetical protein
MNRGEGRGRVRGEKGREGKMRREEEDGQEGRLLGTVTLTESTSALSALHTSQPILFCLNLSWCKSTLPLHSVHPVRIRIRIRP